MEDTAQLTGMAFVIVAATLCGAVMTRLKQPAIVGYIIAGVLLGPAGFGLVSDREQVSALAELGVLMLLYFIGMELSLGSFRHTWRIGLFSTLIQIGASLAAMLVVQQLMGWPLTHAVLFGFVVALSSTAVAVKMLDDVGELRTRVGRTAISVLIAVTRWFGSRQRIHLLPFKLVVGNVDLLPLAAIGWCFGFAALGGLTGLSPAYGAFFAGLLVGNSAEKHAVENVAQPVQSILLMVFFLSVGLLIDLNYMAENILLVLGMWFFVSVFKTALNVWILQLMGEQPQRAFMTSLSLAQIGEFSFVLGATALASGVIEAEIHRLIVAVTVVSLATSPLWMHTVRRLHEQGSLTARTPMALLKVVYVREWRLTLKMTAGLFQWFEGRFIRIKALYWRWKHSGDSEPDVEILPPDPDAGLPEEAIDAPFDDEPFEPGDPGGGRGNA